MKRYLRIFSLIMAMFLFLANNSALLAMPANASSDVAQNRLTDETVREAVAVYFDTRADYLLGKTAAMDWLVVGIPKDEQKHLAQYAAMGIVPLQTTYTIHSLDPSGSCAIVFAIETVIYEQDGQSQSEEILHELRVYPNGTELPLVSADCYTESCSGFSSCSYLPPSTESYASSSSTGSPLCIVEIAKGEIGCAPTADNHLKYWDFFGYTGGWCAMFVSWCANQANISTSVIKKDGDPIGHKKFFDEQNNYYPSENFEPKPGDIFFSGGTYEKPGHIGIVEKVEKEGNEIKKIWVIDGNWSNKVSYHAFSPNCSDLVGFATPNYEKRDHTYTTSWSNDEEHLLTCDICGASEQSAHLYLKVWQYDSTYHWHACKCGKTKNSALHTMTGDGLVKPKTCSVCGYTGAYGEIFSRNKKVRMVNFAVT